MSKLFKLKEWLTLEEAADYISAAIGEQVLIKDILRLALDKHLILSVDLVNHAYAKKGDIVGPEGVITGGMPAPWFADTLKEIAIKNGNDPEIAYQEIVLSLSLGDGLFLNRVDGLKSISGVWDLPLWGNEHLDILHKYQQLIDGPEVTLVCIDGTYVRRGDIAYELQEDFDDNEFQEGSLAEGEKLERRIRQNNLDKNDAEKVMTKYEEKRKIYLKERADNPREHNYYPAGKLPDDVVYVVRTEEILRFLSSLDEGLTESKPNFGVREKNTLLVLLATMLKQADFDYSQRGISKAIDAYFCLA
jgi:hypothetical protein